MEGSLEPAIDGSLGMVNEYDFETKELINQYFYNHIFCMLL